MKILRIFDLRILLTIAISFFSGVVLYVLIPAVLSRGDLAVFALPFLALFFLLMVIRPQIALMLILVCRAGMDMVIDMSRGGGHGMGLGAGINLVVILLLGFMFFYHRPIYRKANFIGIWMGFLLICFCAVFYSPQPFHAFRLFLNFVTYFAMAMFPFMVINTLQDKFYWLKILFISSIVPVAFGDYQFLASFGAVERISGSFQHPNIFGFYLVLMIVIAVIFLRTDKAVVSSFWRKVLRIYLLNLFVLLLFTKTRSAWMACWIVFFIYGLISDRKVLVMVLVMPFLALLVPSIQSRIFDLFQGNDTSQISYLNSFAWRRRLWMDSLPVIAQRPIEGHGLTSFIPMSQTFSDFADAKGVGAHNVYIELLFEVGLLGLTVFIGIWLSLIRFFSRHIKQIKGKLQGEYVLVLGYVISYAVVCFADNMNYYLVSNWYTWFFIGVMVASALKFPLSDRSAKG